MMRSMFSGVSGLRIHQTRMDVIANNIANVNTAGYKTSRVTFFDVFNQTLAHASRPDVENNIRGRNPMQVGLGANLASIDQIMTTGAAQRTDYTFDLMIQGDGFFVVSDEAGNFFFTRAGAFRVDEAGNLTNPSGLAVNGWQRMACPDTGHWIINSPSRVVPLRIDPSMEFSNPEPTFRIDITGNLDPIDGAYPGFTSQMPFFDSLGTQFLVDVTYRFNNAAGLWTATIGCPDTGRARARLASHPDEEFDLPMSFLENMRGDELWETQVGAEGDDREVPTDGTAGSRLDRTLFLQFDIRGNLVGLIPANHLPAAITIPPDDADVEDWEDFGDDVRALLADPGTEAAPNPFHLRRNAVIAVGQPYLDEYTREVVMIPDSGFGEIIRPLPPAITNGQIFMDFRELRQVAGNTNATATPINGVEAGTLHQFTIGEDGIITGIYTNGRAEVLGQIAITQFRNPSGLEKMGGSIFRATANSGTFDGIGFAPGTQGTTMLSGVLEMSNVDLSAEFTDMIITQRGFQSNSRVITTSDEMLMELVNLKR